MRLVSHGHQRPGYMGAVGRLRQVNLLASSTAPAERLIEVMMGAPVEGGGRWQQENAFKHQVERWGFNQLDSRKVTDYPAHEVIPNPARRRIDRSLRLARVREGLARNELARDDISDKRRQRFERELQDATEQRIELEGLRPTVAKRAPLADTELAGKLVRHDGRYKTVLDTIRIACVNAEADLAGEIAPYLPRPAEAKKVLANLLASPGNIAPTRSAIRVVLAPAGTSTETE
jgi:hypothetical protein